MSPTAHAHGKLQELGQGLAHQGTSVLLPAIVGTIAIFLIGQVVYNVWFSPLSKFPGPKLAAATRAYYCYYAVRGRWPFHASELHKKYGDVIRIGPDELSYANGDAFNQIYGFRSGQPELQKDAFHYASLGSGPGIILANRDRHSVIRKSVSHGFSDRAMRENEGVIRGYADRFIESLREKGDDGATPMNIVEWFNFFTFDVMGHLVFGESFHCLETAGYHAWVSLIFDSVMLTPWAKTIKCYPFLSPILNYFMPKDLPQRRVDMQRMAFERAESRKAVTDGRLDLCTGLLQPKNGVTDNEYRITARVFITAGSETTATLMSGATFYLLKNPEKMRKLVAEIRGRFKSANEIDFTSVSQLDYLLACLNESLRMYPPVPDILPRRTGDVPQVICGQTVPPHTSLGVSHWSTYRSPKNFSRPDEFIPERWLDDPAFKNDNKSALNPFSVGPRNCIGKNLAYFEMRLLMSILLWNFDLELTAASESWSDHNIFFFWQKPALMVKLHPRNGISA